MNTTEATNAARILVVDDISANLEIVKRMLQREGYLVFAATNGQEALEILAQQQVELIISDILMPVMDGYQLCRQCQQDEKLRSIPFIFYTATYTEDKDRQFGLSLGASRFIIKPQKSRDFLNIITEVLALGSTIVTQLEKSHSPQLESDISEEVYLRQHSAHLLKKLEDKLVQLKQKDARMTLILEALHRSETKYRAIFEESSDAILLIDSAAFIDCNNAALRLFGCSSRRDFLGSQLSRWSPATQSTGEDSSALMQIHLDKVLKQGRDKFEWLHQRQDGLLFPAEVWLTRIELDAKPVIQATIRDNSERKQAEEVLQMASLVYQNSSEAMMISDAENRIIDINPAFTQMTGYTSAEAIGQDTEFLNSGRQEPGFYQAMRHDLDATGQWQGEVWNKRKDGEVFVVWLTINIIYSIDGAVHRHVALFSDITKKKESEALIWRQANFDSLTDLPNRKMFYDCLQREIKQAQRLQLSLAVLFLDLDHFKEVNDTLGHSIGDQLLQLAACRISSCVRETDILARLGGDEFTLILTNLVKLDNAEQVAQNILQKLAGPYQLQDNVLHLTASIGITLFPKDAHHAEDLLKNADQAMYAAKAAGRNRFCYFMESMQTAALTRMHLANDLRFALAENQFQLYYQPIVDLTTGAISKAEALIRWQHPKKGLISPAEFISVAEGTGLIAAVGDWVMWQVITQITEWKTSLQLDLQISVNKSPLQFVNNSDSRSQCKWLEYMQQIGLPGESLVLEITEGLLLDASDAISAYLLAFRSANIAISIDDFGTGYSSLAYLKKFHINYLKIDRSFICNLAPNSDDLALCEAIIVMAHKLGIKVIAEGVETAEQRDMLIAAGCDYSQGYLFSRPVPVAEFESLLVSREIEKSF